MESIYNWIILQLQTNEVFGGILGGSILLSVLYSLKGLPMKLWEGYLRQFTVETEILSDNEAYAWISEYLSSSFYAKRSRRLKVEGYADDGDNYKDKKWSYSNSRRRFPSIKT